MIFHQPANSRSNFNYNAFLYEGISYHAHFHGNYELIYAAEGQTEIWINGVSESLDKGELLLIPPYTVHALRIGQEKAWIGVFSDDYVAAFSDSHRDVCHGKFRCSKEIETFLQKNLFFEGQPDRFLHMACLYMVCNECIQNAPKLSTGQDQRFIHKVTAYLSENTMHPLDMHSIAKALNYEYHYFSFLFHRCFGMHFKSLLNMFRFNQACKLLSDTSMDLNAICDQCGFGSIRNFNRVFKTLSGTTPSAYRKHPDAHKKA